MMGVGIQGGKQVTGEIERERERERRSRSHVAGQTAASTSSLLFVPVWRFCSLSCVIVSVMHVFLSMLVSLKRVAVTEASGCILEMVMQIFVSV